MLLFFKIDLALFGYSLFSYIYHTLTLFKILNLDCFYILSWKILNIFQSRQNGKNSLMNSHGFHHKTSKIITAIFVLYIPPPPFLYSTRLSKIRYNIVFVSTNVKSLKLTCVTSLRWNVYFYFFNLGVIDISIIQFSGVQRNNSIFIYIAK